MLTIPGSHFNKDKGVPKPALGLSLLTLLSEASVPSFA